MLTIEMLPANEGDALWIEYGPDGGDVHRVLVDCGRAAAYRTVLQRIEDAANEGAELDLELFVMTHVDEDHVFGSVKLMADARLLPERVGEVWFNEWRHLQGKKVLPLDGLGAQQGEYFGALVRSRRFRWNAAFGHAAVVVPDAGPLPTHTLPGGMKLTLLSPTWDRLEAMNEDWQAQLDENPPGSAKHVPAGDWEKALEVLATEKRLQPDALGASDWVEGWDPDDFDGYASAHLEEDTKAPNGSSIAFVAEYDGKRVLLTGDAHPSVLARGLERYRRDNAIVGRIALDAFKLSHHGSSHNVSDALLALVRCERWLVSTNGTKHHHPSPETIARVIAASPRAKLFFNYSSDETKVWDDPDLRAAHGYRATYGDDGGLVVAL